MKESIFRYWKLGQKINFALSLSSGFIILILAFLAYFISEQQLREQSFEHLKSIKESRKQYIIHYFDQIKGQLLTQSENITIKEAIKDFNVAFTELQKRLEDEPMEHAKSSNQAYYTDVFLPRLNANLNYEAKANFLLPRVKATRYLQYHYISGNEYETGQKDLLDLSKTDTSSYASTHAKYHPIIKNFLHEFSYYDIFLINNEGYIIYSVFKEVDFATNLVSGPYSQTNFAKAYKATKNLQKGELVLHDFEPYLPSYSAPASFIATPVFADGKRQGALIFQMPVDKINEIMTGNQNWMAEGLGETGECYVLGNDFKMRSQPRLLQEDTSAYLQALQATEVDSTTIEKIAKMNNAILLQPIDTYAAKTALQGKSGMAHTQNYLGEKVLSAYSHIDLYGLQWGIIAEIHAEEAFAPARSIRNYILLISFALLIMVYFLSRFLSVSIAKPLTKIEKQITQVAQGNLPKIATLPGKDEISAINNALHALIKVQHEITNFSEKIGKGNFEAAFSPRSDKDDLGKALISMQQALKANKEEADIRRWNNEGLTQLSLILRKFNDLEQGANHAIKFISNYVSVPVVGLYIANKKAEKTVLKLIACYAFNREKIIQQEIEAGFGLIGQIFLEGKTTCINKVPDHYLNIRSGLGDSAPNFIALIPMMYNEEVYGILELASFKTLPKHTIAFLEKAGENIAAYFAHLHGNRETLELLERSEQRAKALKEKEYEMQQHLEDLEATRETFQLKEGKLKGEISELKMQLNKE